MKDIDNGLITASLKSENLLRVIELMLEKLHSIQGPESMTLADYQKIYGLAKYFGVAPSTITYWASLGMPVAVIDGRKLYGKQSITKWIQSKEKTVS